MNSPFSLVLGGGAARGLAHIGVIARLEELGVTPQEISGTSMGALIGALYAAGFDSATMKKIALDASVFKLIDFDLKNGLIKGNKIVQYFEQYLGKMTFSDLKIPLSVVATDIDRGQKIIFRNGRVLDAIRASISIPGVFIPYKHHGMHLVDGGIVENLPVQSLQFNYPVIAASAQRDMSKPIKIKKSFLFPDGTVFGNTYTLLRKTIQIMMGQNEIRSIQSRENILVLHIECDDIDYYEFNQIERMIEEGYRASSKLQEYFKV